MTYLYLSPPYSYVAAVGSALTVFLAWYFLRAQRERELKTEFALFKSSAALIPEDLGFKTCKPGEHVPGNIRPYYSTYIPRTAIRYEERHHDKPRVYREHQLIEELAEGTSLLLIGNPTEGKTRTLYELVRRLDNFIVIRTKPDYIPSANALDLLAGKNVVYLLDDLNHYTQAGTDPAEVYDKILRITSQGRCTLAAACRNGPQLAELNAPRSAIQKLYESFALQLQLTAATVEEKARLKNAVGQAADDAVTTLGSICMAGTLKDMYLRFTRPDISRDAQACHMAIQLLATGNIAPYTHRRIQAVLVDVFNRQLTLTQVRDCLDALEHDGFVHSAPDVDPVIVTDYAYFVGPTARPFYLRNHPAETDLPLLADTLKKLNDAQGLFGLALSRADLGEDERFDFEIAHYNQLIEHFGSSKDSEARVFVSYALYNKGVRLGQLGRSEEAIACYDQVDKRFGEASELALKEHVAQSLYNKGLVIKYSLQRPDDGNRCFRAIIERYSNEDTPSLQEVVRRAREQLA